VVLPGDDGVLLVDAGIVGPKVAASVARITRTPMRHLINSHWHFDHTDATELHHAHAAAITAHEKTREHLSTTTRVEDWDVTFPPWPAGALPATVFADEHEVRLNGSLIQLKHYPPAHTDSDIWAHVTDADVRHVADTWWNGLYPFIDNSTGGSFDGTIYATEQTLAKASSTTVIAPGHGRVGDWAALLKWRDMIVTVRDRVAALKKDSQPLSAVVTAKPTASFDAVYGGGIIGPAFFTRIVYERV
jgi:glyoxylase-like metal-dependent hydrolase (beta-lactamase superfamily II)